MLRNLGGSVGIATLSTLLDKREQFHSAKIGEGISLYLHSTQDRLSLLTKLFVAHNNAPANAAKMAIGALDQDVRVQATVMGFNDCFLVLAAALVFASVMILLCDKVKPSGAISEAH